MERIIFNYDEWLSGHASRKTMMEKLERSLVPFEIFEAIGLVNDKQPRSGEVNIGENTYHYDISYDYNCIGHDVYDAALTASLVNDKWTNLLMGYNKFKVVMNHQNIKTIYPDHEDYFQQVIDMFEQDDYAGLYANRSAYINNLLARYILLRLMEVHRPDLQPLVSIRTKEDGNISVLGADANRNEWLMYAFSKREAMDWARRMDGNCKNLTVIYFFNQDFEKDGNTVGYDSGCTRVVSARTWMMSLPMETMERRLAEKRMLTLVSLLYNEHLDWHFDRIERVAVNPPFYGTHVKEQKKAKKEKKNKKNKNNVRQGLPWYQKITRTLLEDALNVLADEPKTHADIFHFLCAANMVNAYINYCNHSVNFTTKQVNRMFQAKQQIFKCLVRLAEEHNPNVTIAVNSFPAILVNMKVEKHDFQISFRGMTREILERIVSTGVSLNGYFEGHYLQPIATALYQYSYLLRWRGLNTTM
ncbi:MAG: hypothetical protein IKG99_12725 [Bacteroidaceae bacterium]|nr:hypothetical protein [Bacteroidaceae bacterium]